MTEGEKKFVRSLVRLHLDNRYREKDAVHPYLRHWFNGRSDGFLSAAKYFCMRIKMLGSL